MATDTVVPLEEWKALADKNSSKPWSTKILPLNKLVSVRIDDAEYGYQRPLSEARVADLIENFDAGEARVLFVSARSDGTYAILDGQHTHAALTSLKFPGWECRVFQGLTLAEEARRFANYQKNTRPIPAVVNFNADVLSGDEQAVAINEILAEFYLRIASNKIRKMDGYLGISSRAVPEMLYKLGGPKLLREVLQLVIDAWGQGPSSFMAKVLQAIGYLLTYAENPSEFDRGRFVAALKNTTPQQIVVTSTGQSGAGGAIRKGAELVLNAYREGVPSEGYSRMRPNAKEAPKLPEKADKSAVVVHEYWSEDTVNVGRTTLARIPAPAPAPTKEEKAAARAKAKAEKAEAAAEAAKLAEAESDGEANLDEAGEPTADDLGEVDDDGLSEYAAETEDGSIVVDSDEASEEEEEDSEEMSYPSEAIEVQEIA